MHNRLLVGYDSSPASRRAVGVAAQLAEALDADLTVLHSVGLEDYPIDPDRPDWEEMAERRISELEAMAVELLQNAPIRWEYETARGDPASALAKAASDLEVLIIVVGASRRNVVRRMSHGSVGQTLSRCQAKPVLVVPEVPGLE